MHEEATDLCPYRNCRRTHTAREFLANDRIKRVRDFIASLKPSKQPKLFYEHVLLPHVPWIFLPSTRRFDRTVLGPITGLNSSDRSVFDRTLVRQSWQRHLLQVGAVDTLLGEMVAQMKRTGLWNRALLAVMADHGIWFGWGPRTVARSCPPTRRTSPRCRSSSSTRASGGAGSTVPYSAPTTCFRRSRGGSDCGCLAA